jgi:hypothetical protein
MVTIKEDKAGEVFKYRAEVELVDGNFVHIILPNVQHFLNSLQHTQAQMGKSPLEMVPIKYASEAAQGNN